MSDNPVRLVERDEFEAIAEWALPRFKSRHPRISLEGMLPLLEMSLIDPDSRLVRTNNACGLFAVERAPWEPRATVCDVFVVGRAGHPGVPFEVSRIYDHGLTWAKQIGAAEFRYGTDGLSDLSGIAERIGCDFMCRNWVKRLI